MATLVYIAFLVGCSVFIVVWLLLQATFGRKLAVAQRIAELRGETAAALEPGLMRGRLRGRSGETGGFDRRGSATDGTGASARNTAGRGLKALRAKVRGIKADGSNGRGKSTGGKVSSGGNASSVKRMSFLATVEVWLRRADIKLPAKDFVTRWLAIVGAVTVLSFVSPLARIGVLIIPLSFVGTLLYLRMRMQRRLHQFNDGLYDMLILVANALRAGHSFVQAMHMIVEESAGPMHEEFGRAEAEMQVGVLLEDALLRMAERVGSEDFDLIVTAISIQRQIGGNLAEVLDKIADTIGERVKLKREIKALTSQGRLSAAIFMGLPAAVGVLLYIMNPPYMSVLFQTTIGLALLVVAVVGQVVGYMFIRKIVNVQL